MFIGDDTTDLDAFRELENCAKKETYRISYASA